MPTPVGRIFGLSVSTIVLLTLFLVPSLADAAYKNPVTVFPSPGTPVASDRTTFSFRGVKPRFMGPIKVYGSRSGRHFGRRLAHSDGKGVSFIPKKKFVPGELVRVFTRKKIWHARKGDFHIRIGRFYGNDDKMGHPGAPNKFPRLHSRPDLRPPKINVLKASEASSPGRIFIDPKQTGLTILDRFGRINWFQMTGYGGNGEQVQNFQRQTYRGQPVLTYWKGASTSRGFSQIGYFSILNRKYNLIARFRMGNGYKPDAHELTLTPRGTALAISYRGVLWNTSRFKGGTKSSKVMDNVIQEIDIKTGAVLFEWHSLGNINLEASMNKPEEGAPWDFFHANAIANDGDSLLVSARHTCTIYRIDRRTGWLRWRMRGDGRKPKANDFKLGPGTKFGYQHDIRRLPNGDISLFDNASVGGSMPTVQKQSSGLILRPSGGGKSPRKVTLVHRFTHKPDPVVSGSQGAMTALPDGHAFVGWGNIFRMTEFSADGDVLFDATFNQAPTNSYRARKARWSGIPKFRPAIASSGTAAEGGTVWASWNGATNIARWRVLTGPNGKHLDAIATVPWKNLETAIPVERFGKLVQVEALDAKNEVIGRSKLTPLGKQAR
jgi:hypothetical protein